VVYIKILNDKYYTSKELAKYVVNKTKQFNISEYLEPSAGAGVFLDYLPKGTPAYDIEPEDERIIKADYLTLDIPYLKGRCIIGNPPYGRSNYASVQFFKKSIQIADYIVFIQPISQLNNNMYMYDFDLVHSEDLGEQLYSNKMVHCCLNIYKRPKEGLNKKPNYKLKDVGIEEVMWGSLTRKSVISKDYDIGIKAWGGSPVVELSSLGEEVKYEGQYAAVFYIKIYNEKFKDKILKLLREVNWQKVYIMTATPSLSHWQVYKYLKEQIPELM